MKKSILFAVAAIVLAGCDPTVELDGPQTLKAEAGARDFAERAEKMFVSCSGRDSDGDGYVTCTLQKGADMQEILCSYETRGCKAK